MLLDHNHGKKEFQEVPEEEVFLTRLVEKENKARMRCQSAKTRIWNKPTATTRAPLQRVREHDFGPARSDASRPNYSYSAKNRSLITSAVYMSKQRCLMSARTRQDKVPLEEYMSQKKEMFRTSMANKMITSEIKAIRSKESLRKSALG